MEANNCKIMLHPAFLCAALKSWEWAWGPGYFVGVKIQTTPSAILICGSVSPILSVFW